MLPQSDHIYHSYDLDSYRNAVGIQSEIATMKKKEEIHVYILFIFYISTHS